MSRAQVALRFGGLCKTLVQGKRPHSTVEHRVGHGRDIEVFKGRLPALRKNGRQRRVACVAKAEEEDDDDDDGTTGRRSSRSNSNSNNSSSSN
ncbi:hypothetical protein SMMN14_08520, partial [Sphaerulina musiva]